MGGIAMMLVYLLKLFGSGRLPMEARDHVSNDSFVAESIPGSITFRNFRAPGRYSSWRRQWFLGSLAVTHERILAYRYRSPLVNLPFDDPRIHQIDMSVDDQQRLVITYDASLFNPLWSGQIELRFDIDGAQHVASMVRSCI